MASITMVSHGFKSKFFKISATFFMLPGLGDQPLAVRSTTSDPFSAAAFAIFPRLDPPTKTVLPLLCTVVMIDREPGFHAVV